ncbi:hypothetical protein [uncultured Enterovirga sp.]|uniref:hypothetical protein n=1 Tax=uncultured Enterovirga sp. TaxID=2026352 RepID=UPI0035C9C5DB
MDGTPNDEPDLSTILADILREDGTGILEERSRLLETLRDRAPHDPRGVHLLITAFDAGVPTRLRDGGPASDFKIGQETAQIVDNFGSSPEPARAAVETWAKVMAGATSMPARPAPASFADPLPATASGTASRSDLVEPAEQTGPTSVQPAPDAQPVPAIEPIGAAAAAMPPARPKPLPLPQNGGPFPVRPLPLPGAPNPIPVRPLPATPGGVKPLPLLGTQATAPAPPQRWGVIVPVVLAVGAGAIWASGYFDGQPPRTAAPKQGDRAPTSGPQRGPGPAPASDPGPSPGPRTQAGSSVTDEGVQIAEIEKLLPFPAQAIDGAPNSLIFTFGLKSGSGTFTYQAAVGFESSNTSGQGLIKAVKRGREATTGEVPVTRITQPDGYVGFTMAGILRGEAIGAPSICVSALVGKSPDRFDVAAGQAGFCAFNVTAGGICGETKLGCGDLVPR